ncbi:hypothetical protein AOQ84DRAFT_372705 [Glonium stellatum]|uniref:NACHT-NTPase and P-loop NTPases N-terminal domain-containing protein n=1 Tax=Glonium stellatum TaxID=574774 RepID=A0A8E2F937_9PEZI|nr:hypothetical protein AOQ84DRAFT_372705 [Glonium stellatum]
MDPLTALGFASNIIQIVDFTVKIISRGHELYDSADGILKDHAILEDAANNLSKLCVKLERLKKLSALSKYGKLSAADEQLLKLSKKSEEASTEIATALERVKVGGRHRKWQKEIRKQVDTALLVSLRKRVDALTDDVIPRRDDAMSSFMDESGQWLLELLEAIRNKNWQSENKDYLTYLTN